MLTKNELTDNSLIIAEVGQNHQGELDLAREYIKVLPTPALTLSNSKQETIDFFFLNALTTSLTIVKMHSQIFTDYIAKN